MKVIKYLKLNVFTILLVLIVFASLFSFKLVPYFIITIVLTWFFSFKSFKSFKSKLIFIYPFYTYCLVVLISFFFANDLFYSLKTLEIHTSFVIIPLVIFCKDWTKKDVVFFQNFFISLVVLIAIISVLNLLYFYVTHIDFVRSMDETYLQWKLPHLTGFHPTYFGFIIVIANVFLLKRNLGVDKILRQDLYIAIFLSLYLLYLSPRTSVICLFIVWVHFLFFRLKNKNLNKLVFIVFFICCILFLLFALLSSTYLTDKILKSLNDRRFILWIESYKIIKENYFILGEGLGSGKAILENYIVKNKLNQFEVPDLHNQYLMNYIDMGIAGLLSLLFMIFKPVFKLKNQSLTLFSIIFSISILTESFLIVIKGIILFTVLLSIFIVDIKTNNKEKSIFA